MDDGQEESTKTSSRVGLFVFLASSLPSQVVKGSVEELDVRTSMVLLGLSLESFPIRRTRVERPASQGDLISIGRSRIGIVTTFSKRNPIDRIVLTLRWIQKLRTGLDMEQLQTVLWLGVVPFAFLDRVVRSTGRIRRAAYTVVGGTMRPEESIGVRPSAHVPGDRSVHIVLVRKHRLEGELSTVLLRAQVEGMIIDGDPLVVQLHRIGTNVPRPLVPGLKGSSLRDRAGYRHEGDSSKERIQANGSEVHDGNLGFFGRDGTGKVDQDDGAMRTKRTVVALVTHPSRYIRQERSVYSTGART